jgi:hypothetical protein
LENSVDQVGRLKSALREAADGFAQPVNDTVEKAVKFLLDEKGLSGGEVLAGGAVATIAGLLALKGGGKLLQKFGSTAGGVAAGKALEEAAGVQPVFVVNWPGGEAFMPGGSVVPGGAVTSTAVAGSSYALALAPLMIPVATVAAAAVSQKIGKALARNEASIRSTEDLIALRSRQMVMGGGAVKGGNFQTRTIDKELAKRYGSGMQTMSGHGQQQMRGEVVVRVKAERGTEARTDQLRSNHESFSLQAETEVGIVSGGAW